MPTNFASMHYSMYILCTLRIVRMFQSFISLPPEQETGETLQLARLATAGLLHSKCFLLPDSVGTVGSTLEVPACAIGGRFNLERPFSP